MASSSSVSLDDLCEDLLVQIFAWAGSASIQDLHSLRLVSKKFYSISYGQAILRRASLDISYLTWNLYPWTSEGYYHSYPNYYARYDVFVRLCLAADNPQALEALFDLGLTQYFESGLADTSQRWRGFSNLARAANRGLRMAQEIYGAILICLGDGHRQAGWEMLRRVRREVPLTPREILRLERHWQSLEWRLWWNIRPGFTVFYLAGLYVSEPCQCDGLTSQWFGSPVWQGQWRFSEFEGMPTRMACEFCLWHEFIVRLFRI